MARACVPVPALLMTVMALLFSKSAYGHDARLLAIAITEQPNHAYRAAINVPPSVAPENQPTLVWPAACRMLTRVAAENASTGHGIAQLAVCPGGLAGEKLGIAYAAYNPSLSTYIRFAPIDRTNRTAVLGPDQSEWRVPPEPLWWEIARDYLRLGIEHIWTGLDHLLFVAGLLVLARSGWRIVAVVTGFTVAHSITLSLAALGIVHVPIIPTEAAIALSILFLAHEIGNPGSDSLAWRFPLLVSSMFGFLHGFGFAAALTEAGLPADEIVNALLCFNVGVELGQIAFVLALVGTWWLLAKLIFSGAEIRSRWVVPASRILVAYAIGIPAAFWFIERIGRY